MVVMRFVHVEVGTVVSVVAMVVVVVVMAMMMVMMFTCVVVALCCSKVHDRLVEVVCSAGPTSKN